MSYDDEKPISTMDSELESKPKLKPRSAIFSKTKITTIHKEKAPMKETNLTMLLELEGNGSEEDKPGVDIVAVLDDSGSMNDDRKLEKMKSAIKFLINILTENHRLSVVTFSTVADVTCLLRPMTVDAKDEVVSLVDNLEAVGSTNIAAGLNLALKVLKERRYTRGRVAAIMLVSDGDQVPRYEKAIEVPVDSVSVFTFGFGYGDVYDPEVLNTIAKNSKGGTFSIVDVENKSDNLSIAFALCLGWLLTVVVQDLQINISATQPGIKINGVQPNYFPIANDDYTATIQLGPLCNREKRSFLVDLQLPPASIAGDYKILEITYSHIYDGQPFDSKPKTVTIFRTEESLDEEKIEVITEKKRIETLDEMKRAIELANQDKFDEAKRKLQQAQNSLSGSESKLQHAQNSLDVSNYPIVKALKSQLEQLIVLMNWDIYEDKGHHIALSMLTAHNRQREAITNDDLIKSNLFATEATVKFAENVKGLFADTDDEPSPRISKLVESFQTLLEAPKTNK